METLSSVVRVRNLSELESKRYDVLVIGGGITGAGVALDAVVRGYKVALVEKADFASGTSSKSTKLVHGGIRYLPNFDFSLVHEALVERGLLVQNANFLVEPLEFVLPFYEGDRHPVGMPFTTPGGVGLGFMLDIGLWMYDLMAGKRAIGRHRRLKVADVERLAPMLLTQGLKEGFTYYDAQTHDARLTMAILRTAAQYGATIANYAEVTSFIMEGPLARGAHVRDALTGQTYAVYARHIINATGVYSDKVEELTGEEAMVKIEPSKGVHLVFSREDLAIGDSAVVLPETDDKRILFIVPWESRVVFGTTDTGTGDLDHPTTSAEDIAYLLKYLNRYLSVNLTEKNIISAYAGYRPLVKLGKGGGSTAKLSRTHVVLQGSSGLVTVTGGKLTTYRRMAQDAIDVISQRDGAKPVHPTLNLPLQGSAGWNRLQHDINRRGAQAGLKPSIIKHLGHSYGTEAAVILKLIEQDPSLAQPFVDDLPYIRAEVPYACQYEMAMTPYDFMARRTSIILEDWHQGTTFVDDVVALMAKEHGWSPSEQNAQAQSYLAVVHGQELAERH
ncbi:glycerol-3-phosphate dehydrogenase/oxidase [Tengunoibacter tsumagoiensis]|nr:glycerol-3-phosphate dehydrogenase/oxidase [Tengunoibacter tsumagoiensis]